MSESFEELRKKEVELQEKQLFAQRVTAVSAAATALASHRAAESLEEMRREATAAAEAAAEHQQQVEEAQQAQLAIIEKEAQAAAKEREYRRQVLFLKESNDSTKLEAYLEMLKKNILNLYKLPEVPEDCKTGGAITSRMKWLAASKAKQIPLALPDEAKKLQSEIKNLENESKEIKAGQQGVAFGCLGILGVVVALFGFVAFVYDKNFATAPTTTTNLAVLGSGAALAFISIVLSMIRAPKIRKLKKQMDLLAEMKDSLAKQLQPFLNEASEEQSRAQSVANKAYYFAVERSMDQWQSVVARSSSQSFFDQGLWIGENRFTERLKAELTQIQKPFPTSCRTDVNNLRPEQVRLVYESFTDSVADLISMCSAIGRDEEDKLKRQQRSRPRILNVLQCGPSSLENEFLETSSSDDELPAPPPIPPEEKTAYEVVLVFVPADRKIAVIKALRELGTNLGLAEAKALVENTPQTVLRGLSGENAATARQMLEKAGAEVRLDMFTRV